MRGAVLAAAAPTRGWAVTGRRIVGERVATLRFELVAAMRHARPGPRLLVLWLALALAVGILSAFAAGAEYFSWDLGLARKIQAVEFPAFGPATKTATDLSSSDVSALVLSAAVAVLLLLRRFRLAFFAAASTWTHLIGGTLKLFVDRTRPSPELVETTWLEDRFSYPSGHTEWVVGFEGFLVFAIWQLTPSRLVRYTAAGIWGAHAVLTGVGRVAQGMHWPSDVLAGLLVGALALSGTMWAYVASRRAAAIVAEQAALDTPIPASTV